MAAGAPDPGWPLESDVRKVTEDFGNLRNFEKDKRHAAEDLPAERGDLVLATEPGRVVRFQTFNGPNAHAVLVETDSGIVINFGEVEPDSWDEFGLSRGSRVEQGQPIARIGVNPTHKDGTPGGTMLHFETYTPGTTLTKRWYGVDTPPPELLDPTDYLRRAADGPYIIVPKPQPDPLEPEQTPTPIPSPSPSPRPTAGGGWLVALGLLGVAAALDLKAARG
jgi:murein DD-endopeptidase MepM/ murein hydrolase activator NlpD